MPRQPTPLYEVFDGNALAGLVYRIVDGCPPTLEDFSSYEALGKPYDRRDFFRGTGISGHTTRGRARATARRYGLGSAIASLALRRADVVWAKTGGRDHITVWRRRSSCSRWWFNVGAMNAEPEYVLLDRLSKNQLGEFASFEEAEEVLLRFVAAAPSAAEHLEIWLDDDRLPVDPDKLRRASAA